MSDATYIELPTPPKKRRPFLRGWRGAVLLLFILATILAGCFSWWLSQGKISSAYARVDSIVYTVETEIAGRLDEIYVYQGQDVGAGQPLAQLTPPAEAAPQQDAGNPSAISEISSRLNTTQETEKSISARLARARTEEERLKKAHQDRVTEHVSALLALRSVNPGNTTSYQYASQMEEAARNRMESAREQFENTSKARAAMEVELARIRYEMQRKKQRPQKAAQTPAPVAPQTSVAAPPAYIYSPLNGKIAGINGRPGQPVQKGQALFLILPADNGGNGESWIQAWFPLSAQRLLKPGQQASIKAGSLHLFGRVVAIASEPQYLPAGQQYAQYIPAQIVVDEPAKLARIAPGTAVECQIQTRYALGENLF